MTEQTEQTDQSALVADLETAYEELRASEEEVRAQQDQIDELLTRQESAGRQHLRMMSLMPVPVLLTDGHGVVRAANVAAAGLLRMRVSRLVGKPVFALIDPSDRAPLRRYLAVRPRAASAFRSVVTFEPRGCGPVPVEATLLPIPGDDASLSWILLRADRDDAPGTHASLPATLTELAALPGRSEDMQDLSHRCASLVQEAIGPGSAVTISVGPAADPQFISSTSLEAQRLDGAQLAAGEGPTFAAFDGGAVIHSRDLHADPRWPRFASHCPPTGGGAVAAPLESHDQPAGTLTVYLASEAWSETAVRDVPLMAAAASAAVKEIRSREELTALAENLRAAMASRAVIEQAKGIVMAQRRCGADAAFAHLVDLSSTHHVKLREVARSIVEGTAMPSTD